MTGLGNKLYILSLSTIVIFTAAFLGYKGYSYYSTPVVERFYHPEHNNFKPGGIYGHGLGILGTFLIAFGVFMYIARKRYKFMANWGRLKYWLEFHIFLCSLGPVLILFHTAFKIGGVVSIAFWSMVAVVASGVIGRYIYIQIPRTIEGRELSLQEVKNMKTGIEDNLKANLNTSEQTWQKILEILSSQSGTVQAGISLGSIFPNYFENRRKVYELRQFLKANHLDKKESGVVISLVKQELTINSRIERLQALQALFRYWHVAHLPFAIIMTIILAVHVAITLALGYKWIF